MVVLGSLAQRVSAPRLTPQAVAQQTGVVCLRGFLAADEIEERNLGPALSAQSCGDKQ